jgi:hypothetical protein
MVRTGGKFPGEAAGGRLAMLEQAPTAPILPHQPCHLLRTMSTPFEPGAHKRLAVKLSMTGHRVPENFGDIAVSGAWKEVVRLRFSGDRFRDHALDLGALG